MTLWYLQRSFKNDTDITPHHASLAARPVDQDTHPRPAESMTYHATLLYYKQINQHVAATAGGNKTAKIVLHSFQYAEIIVPFDAGDEATRICMMCDAARRLKPVGTENTLQPYPMLSFHANRLFVLSFLGLLLLMNVATIEN